MDRRSIANGARLSLGLILWIFSGGLPAFAAGETVEPVPQVAADPSAPSYEGWTGRQIMAEWERRQRLDAEQAQVVMRLTDRSGNETRREMRQLQLKLENGLFQYLMVMDTPASIRGTAVLTWERKGASDDQWTYLPAIGRVKRIVGGTKRSYFLGTDFTHEDFEVEDLEAFRYDRQANDIAAGVPCFVIDAVAEGAELSRETGYARRRIFIDQEHFVERRVDYFDRGSGKHIKTLEVLEIEPVSETAWRPKVSVMALTDGSHSTRLEVVSRDLKGTGLSGDMFTPNYLTSQRHMR